MVKKLPEVLPLDPYYREMVWGGRKLQTLLGKALPPNLLIGEAFELSAYTGRESTLATGPLKGMGLGALVKEWGAKLLGSSVFQRNSGELPLLIKLIDARKDLSIQVHPDDEYALVNSLQDRGKMEAWFVLDSNDGRVAYGLVDGVGPEDFNDAINAGRVNDVVRFFPVQRGDIIFSPPGTVHALCEGVVIYEVQQSSDLTFRIYDYDRPGLDGNPRQLHVDQALEVINFSAELPIPRHWSSLEGASEAGCTLVDCQHFFTSYHCQSKFLHELGDYFAALTIIAGSAHVSARNESYTLELGTTALLPAGSKVEVHAVDSSLEYIFSAAKVDH